MDSRVQVTGVLLQLGTVKALEKFTNNLQRERTHISVQGKGSGRYGKEILNLTCKVIFSEKKGRKLLISF